MPYRDKYAKYKFTGSTPIVPDPVTQAFPSDITMFMPDNNLVAKIDEDSMSNLKDFCSKWFYIGLKLEEWQLVPKDGIKTNEALQHVNVCLRSWSPKQEDKLLGCAVLMNTFFTKVEKRG